METVPPREAEEWRRRALEATRAFATLARERWPKARIVEPRVSFDLRGLSAGEACAETGSIRYNEELLLRNGRAFVDEIVPHEVAHLVVDALRGRRRVRPHGREWRAVMEAFGVPPRRCHTFEAEPARRVRRFAYRCRCEKAHLLTKRAHLRIRRGSAEYSCRQCGNVLVRTEG
ncbi:SprT-like domain-containing protein [bacterium]|nr:SprT-like domain-containing protein [bacterium]